MVIIVIHHDNSTRILDYSKPENESFRKQCAKDPDHLISLLHDLGNVKLFKIQK